LENDTHPLPRQLPDKPPGSALVGVIDPVAAKAARGTTASAAICLRRDARAARQADEPNNWKLILIIAGPSKGMMAKTLAQVTPDVRHAHPPGTRERAYWVATMADIRNETLNVR
jgi:hypothetical protein